MIKEAIGRVVKGEDLTETDMTAVMNEVMTGGASPAQTAAFLTALRMKGETVAEITGAARVMREKATGRPSAKTPSTLGTGRHDSMTFNISTARPSSPGRGAHGGNTATVQYRPGAAARTS